MHFELCRTENYLSTGDAAYVGSSMSSVSHVDYGPSFSSCVRPGVRYRQSEIRWVPKPFKLTTLSGAGAGCRTWERRSW